MEGQAICARIELIVLKVLRMPCVEKNSKRPLQTKNILHCGQEHEQLETSQPVIL